ncbi:MAG: TRAP transporter substrate-binding protein [Rhodospirillales bacterium]|jgi:TRAP-type C4-dicarboxylate transport system substrate-binding protein|nr:TRAP transporter substrate-binding protein [Rhodospirillales bacterium]MDP6646451.1 TRAP transporter substrate-binding protein [Rhodospirillales bacterium]|tara:strand:+ start:511 stop:1545 length:1035 start_codon:yes stop_codon:yes gene_type:complete
MISRRTIFSGAAIGVAAAFGLAVLAMPAGSVLAAKYNMKIATATPKGNQNVWMARFKERVEKRAGGDIAIKLFPSSQLGTIPRTLEGLQLGTVEAWVGPTGFVKGIEPRYQVLDAPGLFQNLAHAQNTISDPSFRDFYLNLGEKKGIKGISIYPSGLISVVTRTKPIRKVADYKGLKIRVLASDMEVEAMKRLGAAPTPMPLLEVLPSLQRGAIDAVKSALVIFVPFKYWTISKYLTESDEGIIPTATFVSTLWFNKLPGNLQNIILEEGKKLDEEMYKFSLGERKFLQKLWVKNGGELIQLPPAEKKALMSKMETVGATVVAKNAAVKKVYERLLKVAAKHRK